MARSPNCALLLLSSIRAVQPSFRYRVLSSKGQACFNTQWAVKAEMPGIATQMGLERAVQSNSPPLARLPTSHILRTLFLSLFFTSPVLFKPGIAIFSKIANSSSAILHPDNNPLLKAAIRSLVYDQFCAGANAREIQRTSSTVRGLGFSGIVLCYGKEVQLKGDNSFYGYAGKNATIEAEVQEWLDGNLQTLDMIKECDWLGVKFTGAGLQVTKALMNGEAIPESFARAIRQVCRKAAEKGCRVWVDAEQQILQGAIDNWTFDLMREFNTNGKAIVYSTIQAYLKSARNKVERQLRLAAEEGWHSGMKLVRGAYIANDQRDLIHDTKADTDASYNGIVEDLLRGQNFSVFESYPKLKFDFLLAGHNTYTIRQASRLANELHAASKLQVTPEFAQLQGMADDIGCELLQTADDAKSKISSGTPSFVPKVYKCLTWGTTQECMQYLTRRLIENRGAADRMKEGASLLRQELWRRFFRLSQ